MSETCVVCHKGKGSVKCELCGQSANNSKFPIQIYWCEVVGMHRHNGRKEEPMTQIRESQSKNAEFNKLKGGLPKQSEASSTVNEIEHLSDLGKMQQEAWENSLLKQGEENKWERMIDKAKERKAELLLQIATGFDLPSDMAGFDQDAQVELNGNIDGVSKYANDIIKEAKNLGEFRSRGTTIESSTIVASDVLNGIKKVRENIRDKLNYEPLENNNQFLSLFDILILISSAFFGAALSVILADKFENLDTAVGVVVAIASFIVIGVSFFARWIITRQKRKSKQNSKQGVI